MFLFDVVKKIWHHYALWEEVPGGMWRDVTAREAAEMMPKAVEFTGDAERYGEAMLRVPVEWPISTEHNLSDTGQNRRAWIGHAAACLSMGFPEYVTRKAWGYLSQKQQDDANEKASQAIAAWERIHERENTEVDKAMGKQMLLAWNN